MHSQVFNGRVTAGAEVSCTGFGWHTGEDGGACRWLTELGSPIDHCINYCTRGMWKTSYYRLKEGAVEAAVFTFPRPMTA